MSADNTNNKSGLPNTTLPRNISERTSMYFFEANKAVKAVRESLNTTLHFDFKAIQEALNKYTHNAIKASQAVHTQYMSTITDVINNLKYFQNIQANPDSFDGGKTPSEVVSKVASDVLDISIPIIKKDLLSKTNFDLNLFSGNEQILKSKINTAADGALIIDSQKYTPAEVEKAYNERFQKRPTKEQTSPVPAPSNSKSKLTQFIELVTLFELLRKYGFKLLILLIMLFPAEDLKNNVVIKLLLKILPDDSGYKNIFTEASFRIQSPNVLLRSSSLRNSKIACILPCDIEIFVIERNKKTKMTKIVFKDELTDDYIEGWIQSRFVTTHVKN